MRLIEIKKSQAISKPINDPVKLQMLLDSFINEQDVKPTSKANYRRVLKQYFNWVAKQRLEFKNLTRVNILDYKNQLLNSGMSSLSVATYLSSVRRFYEWAESHKLYPNIAKGVKSPKRFQQFRKQALTPEQSTKLLNHFKETSKRDYAIICLLLGCGLRTIELIRANVEDMTLKSGKRIIYVHGKGRDEKIEFVKIPDHVYSNIQNYLSIRANLKANEPLFTSISNNSRGMRLTTRSISKIAKVGLRAIGLDDRSLTAHSLRHTTAVSILKAGLSIQHAQGVLRHMSSTTTQIYISSIQEELRLEDQTDTVLNNLFN